MGPYDGSFSRTLLVWSRIYFFGIQNKNSRNVYNLTKERRRKSNLYYIGLGLAINDNEVWQLLHVPAIYGIVSSPIVSGACFFGIIKKMWWQRFPIFKGGVDNLLCFSMASG